MGTVFPVRVYGSVLSLRDLGAGAYGASFAGSLGVDSLWDYESVFETPEVVVDFRT